jgi:hypothetical protein
LYITLSWHFAWQRAQELTDAEVCTKDKDPHLQYATQRELEL